MLRRLHTIVALAAALLVSLMAITGAVLSVDPAIEVLTSASSPSPGASVADLGSSVATRFAGVERIERTASGSVIVHFVDDNGVASADYADPATGASVGPYEPSQLIGFFTELHRSLFLGGGGRIATGVAALALVVLALSGTFMLARRLGGWSRLFRPARGTGPQWLHVQVGRLSILGLLLSAITGLYMSLVAFGFLGDGSDAFIPFPDGVDGGQPAAIADLAALRQIAVADLRELVFPAPDDPTDAFTVTTASGQGFVDQSTGALLSFTPNGTAQSLYELIYRLHTGQGSAWWLGLILGVAALGVPAMAASGVLVWWRRRKEMPRLRGNASSQGADIVILVGSEGGATWGFAATLHDALIAAGKRVHTAPMNRLARDYPRAERLFILTSTYGNGEAPSSARSFLDRLGHYRDLKAPAFAVLAFGDRSFPKFCQFGVDVETALIAKGWVPFQWLEAIDRQSSQAFSRWGEETGARLGLPLHLTHVAAAPATQALTLASRRDYGLEVQAPTVVLRFHLPATRRGGVAGLFRRGLARFSPGDLVGIIPPGSTIPRYYSLASGTRDGVVEICVRKQSGGLCSEFLHALQPGDVVDAFVRSNPDFRPDRRRTPLILVGAGTGIAPLAGFIRGNIGRRSVHLYWGGRDPRSDFLYEETLAVCLADSRLTRLVTAFSRVVDGGYVQGRIERDAEIIRALLARGAQVLVCGGKDMARGVRDTIETMLPATSGGVAGLKSAGRYLEDVY